jgi:hypothetical protein
MTTAARHVLKDCRLAHAMLEDETEPDKFRVLWVAASALIRSVGQVLDKIDGQDPHLRAVARERYNLWRKDNAEHLIFRNFIKQERDLVIHEYRSNLDPRENLPVAIIDGRPALISETDAAVDSSYRLDENIFRPFAGGRWAGEDVRDVLLEAMEWWERELTVIDAARDDKRELQP